MKKKIREKKHRLEPEFYLGIKAVSFTLCIKEMKKVFTNQNIFRDFEEILNREMEKSFCDSLIYLFMPDHIHLILQGKEDHSNVLKCVYSFKQKTGYWLSQNIPDIKWQKDFYDHIIRNEEDFRNQLSYILNNPVRKGLVDEWQDYKFKGSTIYDLDELEV